MTALQPSRAVLDVAVGWPVALAPASPQLAVIRERTAIVADARFAWRTNALVLFVRQAGMPRTDLRIDRVAGDPRTATPTRP